MKKLVLSIALLTATTVNVFANNITTKETRNVTTTISADVNTFCKLIREGNFEAVKAMIENGENINKKSSGLTPLMYAARYNKVKIAQLLIDRGAKLKAKSDRGGFTALKWAKLTKATKVISIIEKALQK